MGSHLVAWPLPNVHLGVSVEDQATAYERIPLLLQTPAVVRWISAEPLLGPVDLSAYMGATPNITGERIERYSVLDWLVVGGESGPGHRPMDITWLEQIAAQCEAAGVPLYVKQDSGPKPGRQGRIPDALWQRKAFPLAAGRARP